MNIKRFLKICDFYGTKFHWYIGYKPKFYSFYGGLFSILSLVSWIIVFIIFGLENFKRSHPIINTSTIPPNGYKNIGELLIMKKSLLIIKEYYILKYIIL